MTTATDTATATTTTTTASPAQAPATLDNVMVKKAVANCVPGFVPAATEDFAQTALPATYTPVERRCAALLAYDLYRGLPKVALAWRRRHAIESDVLPAGSGSLRWLLAPSALLKSAEAETRRIISQRLVIAKLGDIAKSTERSATAHESMAASQAALVGLAEKVVASAAIMADASVEGATAQIRTANATERSARATQLTADMLVAQHEAAKKLWADLKAEEPKAETPAAETPAAEAPKAETPAAETPAAEAPKAETPATEAPKAASAPSP